jgi:uncharacterized membrane protein YjdF
LGRAGGVEALGGVLVHDQVGFEHVYPSLGSLVSRWGGWGRSAYDCVAELFVLGLVAALEMVS